jgi:endonuclease V-like protein UPF0215 family
LLKREARILGLSGTTICGNRILVSVVFRGSLWLDGVATSVIEAPDENYTLKASNLIRSTKQFSQLHAIIISRQLAQDRELSIQELTRKLRLPVIAIKPSKRSRVRNAKNFEIDVGGKHVAVSAAGVGRDEAERLYGIGCSPHLNVPEAVRIADLLAKQLSRPS